MDGLFLASGARGIFVSCGCGKCARENGSNQFGHRTGQLPDSALPGSRMEKVAGY
jgi:hypothetical protein